MNENEASKETSLSPTDEREVLREEDSRVDSLQDSVSLSRDSFLSDMSCHSVDKKKYNVMNFALSNARSLPPKILSLVEAFDNLELAFFMISETWIANGKKMNKSIKDLTDSENIELICKNRPSRGGGVCIAFNKRLANLKRFPLPTSSFEVVCAVGKVNGFSKKIAIMTIYVPPQYNGDQVQQLCDYISECLEKVRATLGDSYVCVGGDINNKDIGPAFRNFPELVLLPGLPTRFGAALDLCYANFKNEVHEVSTHRPLENLRGVESDHLIVSYNFRMTRRHDFVVTTRQCRKITEEGIQKFRHLLQRTNWGTMDGNTPSRMVEIFDGMVGEAYEQSFPVSTIKSRNTDLPWVTKRIKRIIRRKKRRYKKGKRDHKWKRIDAELQQELISNRQRHLEKVKKRVLEEKNPRAYFAAVNIMKQKCPPAPWSPSSLFPDKNPKQVAESCAEYFNSISSEFAQIGRPLPPDTLLPPEL